MKGIQMSNRECGGCTACCFTHLVVELNKPETMMCEHCDVNRGCKIYTRRPPNCQNFRCQWLMGLGSEKHRPDRTGVVLDFKGIETPLLENPLEEVASMWEAQFGALNNQQFREAREIFLESDLYVFQIYVSGQRMLFLPKDRHLSDNDRKAIESENVEIIPFEDTLS